MQYIYGTQNIKITPKSVVILGNFDGIHIGHQRLFDVAKDVGKRNQLQTVVFSFHPHPTWVLGGHPKPLLMSYKEKKHTIEELGMDIYVEYPFTPELSQISALDFVTDILLTKLNAKAVVIGNNYFFGKNKEGNAAYMRELAQQYNFELYIVSEVKKNEMLVSSTLIRDLIMDGKINMATELLGHAYTIRGTVISGKKLGRTLGFPTVNIIPDIVKVLPPNGVYITRIHLLGNQYYGITNIGYNPTVNGKTKIVETFIFNFAKDVYGEEVEIELIQYIRPEMQFASVSQLKEQIHKDKVFAEHYIENVN